MVLRPIGLVLIALPALSLGVACEGSSTGTENDPLKAYCPIESAEVEARIDALLQELTLPEKASLMHGVSLVVVDGTWHSTALPERGIPGLHMLDGPKGVGGSELLPIANNERTTAFPVAIARSATWDRELESRVGAAIGQELRAVGADTLLAPGLNIAWHPLSGRNQEYYGEDPFLSGELGVAFVKGVQGAGVIATAKHFTANHIEDTRLDLNVVVDEKTLRENFLPQFRKVVQEGAVGSVMSAYNLVNGTYCAENEPLLGDILKDEWGFAGFVVSDFVWGTHNTIPSAVAGLDVEMPVAQIYGDSIVQAVEAGDLPLENVDEHVRRILRAQFCYEIDTDPPVVDPTLLETDETLALAREVSARSITLLKNESDLLPLSTSNADTIVLVGPLADEENIGDIRGSSGVKSTEVITIAEGLLARDDVAAAIEYVAGDLSAAEDRDKVRNADVVIVAVGLTAEDEGEGQVGPPLPSALGAGDRDRYGLPEEHETFVSDVLAYNENVVVVMEGGTAIDVSPWFDDVSALVMAWYPGLQGGHAIADILFGDAEPSGRLPVSFPASLDDLQPFPQRALEAEYEPHHGYQRLDLNGVSPFFPFGFGLSYTSFEFANLDASTGTEDGVEQVRLRFQLTNTGDHMGIETAQVYAGTVESTDQRPVRRLVGFAQVTLEAGEATTVEIGVPVSELATYEVGEGWVVESRAYRFEVGSNVADLPLSVEITL